MEKFTVDEIRAYFQSMGGLDVAMANLSAESIRKVSPLPTKEDIMRDFVLEYPSYEAVLGDEYDKIRKAYEKLQPFHTANSLHVNEERYLINDEIYSVCSAISGEGNEVSIERLTNKDKCKHKHTHFANRNQEICSRCAYMVNDDAY